MSKAVKIYKHFERPKEVGIHHRVVCLTGKDKGIAYFLIGKRIVFGRAETTDIRVHDIKSSREHAEIILVGKDYVLTDLGSQNGIIVNDLKVKQHVLNEGDKIIIGQTVYSFSRIEIESEKPEKSLELVDEDDDEFESEEGEPKNNKTVLMLGVVALGGMLLLFSGEEPVDPKTKKMDKYIVNEISDPFTAALTRKKKESKETKTKMAIYFSKGLREFREGNYFRAMSEFENALSWNPNDLTAQFYLRKTKEALNKTIKTLFLKGKRDEDSLKYNHAITSYCSVLRLLHNYPEDERYKHAVENVNIMEEKLGMDAGSVECAKKIK